MEQGIAHWSNTQMNQNIEKLANQTDAWFEDDRSYSRPAWNKKFAELVIAECTKQCEIVANIAEVVNHGEMARKTVATAKGCANMINAHFGVE
jgi:hypothetical protein